MKLRYYRSDNRVLRRKHVLLYKYFELDVSEDVKRYCLGELHFYYGKYTKEEISSACFTLGRYAAYLEGKRPKPSDVLMYEERIISEAEGIVRCLNLCPKLMNLPVAHVFDALPTMTIVKPSMDVVKSWDNTKICRLFLDNEAALDELLPSCINYLATTLEPYRLIDTIVKTKHAVRIFIQNDIFCDKWDYIFQIIDRANLITGLQDYPRRTMRMLWDSYGIEKLYLSCVREKDMELKAMVMEIIRVKVEKDRELTNKDLLRCLDRYEEALVYRYYEWYIKVEGDPETLVEWLEN